MNFNWLTESIDNPKVLVNSEDELLELKKRYPYFSILHVFDAKREQLKNGLDYQDKIKKAAIYSPNRSALYEYVIKPNVEQAIAKQETKLPEENDLSQTNFQNAESKSLEIVTEPTVSNKEKEEKRALEQEILSHAISASILKESEADIETALPESKDGKNESPPEAKVEKLEVKIDDSMNVLAWLAASSSAIPQTQLRSVDTEHKVNKSELIENFINQGEEKIHLAKDVAPTLHQIHRPQAEFFSPENMAKMSLAENEDFVTETLAKIYAQQGNIKKAISAYEKLSLKIPEKSNYFARLIQELKEN